MPVITRSNHPDALWPGVKAWYGKKYGSITPEWSQIFDKRSSDKFQERVIETTGFGLAAQKPEGSSITYDSDLEGTKSTFSHVVWGSGYIVTREEQEDDLYSEVSNARAGALAFSMRTTAEIVHANVLNRAFSGSYLGGDGASLVSLTHSTLSGSQSNRLTVDADLSETALESMLKQMAQARNARNLNIPIMGEKLIVSTDDMFNAERILKTNQRVGTANNDINAIKAKGLLPGGYIVNRYLTDLDAWFIQTNVEDGLISFWRREVALEKDNDFDTENAKAKSTMRFSAGWGDFRSLYGSQGA